MTTTLLHTRHKDGTLKDFPTPQSISVLAPFSALIISLVLIILFLIRYYILEAFLIPSLYGRIYSDLSDLNRRGFINHHIAGVTKIVILVVASYPFISVTFAEGSFHTPYVEGSVVTLGDLLVVVAQMLIGMYAFELIYRVRLSPVAVMHHIGTIVIGQVAIAISLRLDREPDADYEFVLCTVWGAFDIISEFFPHIAIILYRIFPQRHYFLSRVFLYSCITTATGTTAETIVTMYLFGSLWPRWEIAFKVTTPMLHLAFSAAQVHGSLVFWRMYKRQMRFMEEEKGKKVEDVEIGAVGRGCVGSGTIGVGGGSGSGVAGDRGGVIIGRMEGSNNSTSTTTLYPRGVMEECRSDVVVLRGDEEDLGCCSRSASDNDNTSWDGGGGGGGTGR